MDVATSCMDVATSCMDVATSCMGVVTFCTCVAIPCVYLHYVLLQRVKPKSRGQDAEETTSVLTSKSCECDEGKWEGWELRCDSAEGKGREELRCV